MKILFSDEKSFDIDGVYDSQNDRVWAASRADADRNGGIKEKRKFPQKVMVWLGACSKGVTQLVMLNEETMDHVRCIKEMFPVALKYSNKIFGNDWALQYDGAWSHTHHLTKQWCQDHFLAFIDKNHWPPNNPDLNPLNYCIWDKLVEAINWNKVT